MSDAAERHHWRVHQFQGLRPGPRLLVLGAVHGNEVAGTQGIQRMVAELDAGALRINRGCVTFVPVTNPLAHELGRRMGDRNLNRNLRPTAVPQDFEDRIGNLLCPLLDSHDALLDLHSFQGAGEAFVMIGEIGGDAEERAAEYIKAHVTKPVVGYVAGFTAPEGKTMGHAGAIVSGSSGTAQAKKEALEAAGVKVGKTPSETAALMREVLQSL